MTRMAQNRAIEAAVELLMPRSLYMLSFDLDEYLVLPPFKSVSHVLGSYLEQTKRDVLPTQIFMPWRLFTPDDRIRQPDPTAEPPEYTPACFTRRTLGENRNLKF